MPPVAETGLRTSGRARRRRRDQTRDRLRKSVMRAETVAIIPARLRSARLPGKALALIGDRPMVCHVADRTRLARGLSRVLVATDDERIRDAVASRGGQVVMTRADHASGTDRLAEVAAGLAADVVVNVQG